MLLMLLSKLQGGCKSPFLAQKKQQSNFMLSIVLHGIVWYYMELLCILWYRIVFMLNRMVLHGIVLYLTVLHGIALLALARGLYLARHLSTLYYDHQIVINNFPSLLYLKVCTLAACNSQLTALLLLHILIAGRHHTEGQPKQVPAHVSGNIQKSF